MIFEPEDTQVYDDMPDFADDLFDGVPPIRPIRKRLREADKVGVGHSWIESLYDSLPFDIIIKGLVSDEVWENHLDYVKEYFDKDDGESSIGFDVMCRRVA